MDPLDVTTLNPHLAPIKDEASLIQKAIERFKKDRGFAPVYIRFPRRAWQSGIISGYCGLITKLDDTVYPFELE